MIVDLAQLTFQGFDLTLNGNTTAYEWWIENMNLNLTVNGNLEVAQNMYIQSQDEMIVIAAEGMRKSERRLDVYLARRACE